VDQPGLLVFDIGSENPRLLLQIAERLDRERLTFFQVAAKGKTRFAVRPLKYRRVEAIVRQVLLSRGLEAEISAGDFALVSVVGEALRSRLDHWEEKAERVLADSKTEVHGGARDDISLSLLVPGDRRTRAVTELHKALVL
jgi:aspartokinase